MELVNLCTAFMIMRYRKEFEILFRDLYMENDLNVVDLMHYTIVGCATPPNFIKHS